MKIFYSLPTDEAFYTRYASLIPTLDKLGYLAQVVSALTEFGIIYALILDSLADFWPDHAPRVALVGGLVGTAFIEVGLRKFAPYSARAILDKRFSGLDGWMTGFVLAACIGLLCASGALSFFGSKRMVEAVAPEAALQATTAADSTATEERVAALATWSADSATIAASFAGRIAAVETATDAAVRRERASIAALRRRERAEGRSYATRRAEVAVRLAGVQAEGAAEIARLEGLRADELATARKSYRRNLDAAKGAHAAATALVNEANRQERAQIDSQVARYGGGLAYFTVLCLAVFVLSVSLKEIHRAGAGMAEQIEPDAYTFEAGPWEAFTAAIGGRVNRRLYGIIHQIERNTREAPEPVAAPIVWARDRAGIPHETSTGGVDRRAADHRRRWWPAIGSGVHHSPAPGGSVRNAAGGPAVDVARERLEASIMSYIDAALNLENENHHEQAKALFLKADDVLRAYLGPKAMPETVATLRNACIEYLNNNGPNPFEEHHHRRQIGFGAATDSTAKNCRIDDRRNAVTNDPVITDSLHGSKLGPRNCDQCGELYAPKTWNQRFCSSRGDGNCKTAYHAEQHGGEPFRPHRYHGKK